MRNMATLEGSSDVSGSKTQGVENGRGDDIVYSVALKGDQYSDSHLILNTCRVRTVRAGTLQQLIEHLAPPSDEEGTPAYRTCFLLTYRTFAQPRTVLLLLIERYNGLGKDVRVQSSIISFLRVWLEQFPLDFYQPPSHPDLTTLEQFAEGLAGGGREVTKAVGGVRRRFAWKDSSLDVEKLLVTIPSSSDITGHPFHLFSLTPKQLADSLTAEDAYLFHEVVPHQCLEYVRDMKGSRSPSVRACIGHFNRVSLVVIATILDRVDGGVASRTQVLSQWIDTARHCRLLKNFSSLKAILSGMQSSAVFRLKKTWEALPSEKHGVFHDLAELFSVDSNHQISRDLLTREGTAKHVDVKGKGSKSVQGVVPYLGMFLTDLTMVHTAHKDTTPDGLINFHKRRKEFEILAKLTLYQKAAANYSLPHNPRLIRWLRERHSYSDQESYKLSQQLEPTQCNSLEIYPPQSPTLTRRTFRHFFQSSSKVSDLATSVSPHRQSAHLSSLEKSPTPLPPPLSPSHTPGVHAIKVAVSTNESCCYKSILLNESERTGSVVKNAMEKHGLRGPSSLYSLVQLVEASRKVLIPENVNVFYALSCSPEEATLLLQLKKS